jgi:predicted ABC-type transport system involved in lysophospholipase L1 biosynthesis ATPase subunit
MTHSRDVNQPAIEAFNLTKIYMAGNTEVVAMNDVSLCVERGEVVALLGPSGAGKSTLLTAIGLINPPTRGRINIGGVPVLEAVRPMVDLREFRRKHLGFIFQKANLIPFLTAVENIQVALEINDTPPRAARRQILNIEEPPRLSVRVTDAPQLFLRGGRGIQYDIQQSSDLRSWASVSSISVTNLNGFALIPLPELPESKPHFFRAQGLVRTNVRAH